MTAVQHSSGGKTADSRTYSVDIKNRQQCERKKREKKKEKDKPYLLVRGKLVLDSLNVLPPYGKLVLPLSLFSVPIPAARLSSRLWRVGDERFELSAERSTLLMSSVL